MTSLTRHLIHPIQHWDNYAHLLLLSQFLTIVSEPLSSDLMAMSFRLLRNLEACRLRVVKLSLTGAGLVSRGHARQPGEKRQVQIP